MSSQLLHKRIPPATYDMHPERPDQVKNCLEVFAHRISGQMGKLFNGRRQINRMVAEIEGNSAAFAELEKKELTQRLARLRVDFYADALAPKLLIVSFTIIREMSRRTIGMYHYASQLTGGLVMLRGMVAEMETGEGKTLTATLSAATAALAGMPVHVISVNDYLTARDAENMRPLYQALGLTVGCVVHGQTPSERRQAYSCDITYATNKELVFDYLRDRLTLAERLDPLLLQTEYLHATDQRSKRILLRGLHFAIVDEADSILIDEARTPLIISGGEGGDDERQFLQQALDIAYKLESGCDYNLDEDRQQVSLTEVGKQRVEQEVESFGPLWNGHVRRESTLQQALTAIHFFQLDEQYLIRDGKIQIIDQFTGRVMADRTWEQGLHQLIELKEGCELTQGRETLAKISYQRFFRRYLHLSGMTGTAKEVAGELWAVYHLPTMRVATHRPVIRQIMTDQVFVDQSQKWEAVVAHISRLHKQGRPVLIGTQSVAASEQLSSLVAQAGLKHQVLNAKQDEEEARIIAAAGNTGSITIATNMAGRGTDILLGEGVCAIGGLHVIATERHEAARIDRQLAGRCGRQGDPGSYQALLSCDDLLLEGNRGGILAQCVKSLAGKVGGYIPLCGRWAIYLAQLHMEKHNARIRHELFKRDQAQGGLLSFTGRLE
jgi:preprotein translocase subunit SecA